MKRLYYSPRVYVYIRSSTQNGKIYDVSEDVVSGQVVRNIGSVSTAEIVLRNRFRKWLKDPSNKKSIFLPMDMVTIWLQRIGGKPIQVFTGYLDSVPYYQAYPGNCTLRATCTLKKIAYTWFDPGLSFFANIVNDLGWVYNPSTGEAINPAALSTTTGGNPNKPTNDAGFGRLLYEFLVQICNWNPNNVYISNLPATLPKKAAEMYKKINQGVDADLNSLSRIMSQVMSLSFSAPSGQTTSGTLTSTIENVTKSVKVQADHYKVNLLVLVTAGLWLTGYDPKFYFSHKDQPDTWGYGLFADRPKLVTQVAGGRTTTQEATTINGHPLKALLDPTLAAELFCRRLISVDVQNPHTKTGVLQEKANQGDAQAIREWIEKARGRGVNVATFNDSLTTARQWVGAFNTTSGTNNSTNVINTPILTLKKLAWTDPDVTSLMNARERKLFTQQYQGKILAELAPYYFFLKKTVGGLELAKKDASMDSSMLLMTTSVTQANPVDSAINALKGRPEPNLVIGDTFFHGVRGSQILVHGAKSNGNSHTDALLNNMSVNTILVQAQAGSAYPNWDGQKLIKQTVGATTPDPTKSSFNQNGLTFQDFAKLSLNASFTGQFAFPVSLIESRNLTGEKALMNDVSCLDAVGQFCAASMRTYMTLPNGKFLAFYPDYFGSHGRKAYWPIYDIEITNMGIQLNDEALATHVYVVGDTQSFQNAELEPFNYIASRGVATLTQASILENLIVPLNQQKHGANQKEDAWGRLKDAYSFLQHYGARPYKEEQPLIRNTFYEFLYAWQRFEQKWSQTFSTNVEFTFQPEIMAGGIIYFVQHNLQMFVESVTHSFDYQNGFYTSATLTSPAAVVDNGLGVASLPGFALAGSVNSVGTAS